jgi:hypothetical protein
MNTLEMIKQMCEDEVGAYNENPELSDGTQEICEGRFEFAQGVLKELKTEHEQTYTVTLTEDELFYLTEYLEKADGWRRSLSGATTLEEIVDDPVIEAITEKLIQTTYDQRL